MKRTPGEIELMRLQDSHRKQPTVNPPGRPSNAPDDCFRCTHLAVPGEDFEGKAAPGVKSYRCKLLRDLRENCPFHRVG